MDYNLWACIFTKKLLTRWCWDAVVCRSWWGEGISITNKVLTSGGISPTAVSFGYRRRCGSIPACLARCDASFCCGHCYSCRSSCCCRCCSGVCTDLKVIAVITLLTKMETSPMEDNNIDKNLLYWCIPTQKGSNPYTPTNKTNMLFITWSRFSSTHIRGGGSTGCILRQVILHTVSEILVSHQLAIMYRYQHLKITV